MGTYQTNADGIEICQLLVLWEWQVAIEAPSEASSQLLEDIYFLLVCDQFTSVFLQFLNDLFYD